MRTTNNMRLMKVLEIQKNYTKHKHKLMSIQSINRKQKPITTALDKSEASISYHRNKLNAEIFSVRTKNKQINHQNSILLSKIRKQYNKKHETNGLTLTRTLSNHSARSTSSSRALKTENERIFVKLNNAKSIYENIRSKPTLAKTPKREELLHLLINQFGVKPKVLFPNSRTEVCRPLVYTEKSRPAVLSNINRNHLKNIDFIRQKYQLRSEKRLLSDNND